MVPGPGNGNDHVAPSTGEKNDRFGAEQRGGASGGEQTPGQSAHSVSGRDSITSSAETYQDEFTPVCEQVAADGSGKTA